ncbi:MAG: polysaccharide lyase family 8 super-sandwich domain-containing protein [Eubacteriales bacterium]
MTNLIKRYVSALWNTDAPENTKGGENNGFGGSIRPHKEAAFFDTLIAGDNGLYWADLDYTDKTVSYWKCNAHLGRLCTIIAANGEKRLNEDAEYRQTLLGALDFWLIHDFINPNWWHNQIGVPGTLANICLLMDEYIDDRRREKATEILGRGSIRCNPAILKWTGANLLWGVWGTIRDAMFLRDFELLRQAVVRTLDELTEAKGLAEGIKEDRSFYQHGAQLYSGGYGRAFTSSIADMAYLFGSSGFQFPHNKLELFCEYVLLGQRYMTRRSSLDYLCVGRELSRQNALSASSIRLSVIKMLQTPEMPHKDALRAYLAELEGNDNGALCETRWFRNSYILCHHRTSFYMSVKGSHSDFIGTECGNFENYLGYNLTFGGNTCFMSDGKEYYNINPVWDFSMLPGTTSFRENDAALLRHTGAYDRWYSRKGSNPFCAGVSDGRHGAMYMKTDHDGLTGNLSFFFFDFGMVALGTNITYKVAEEAEKDNTVVASEIVTTINQCFLDNAAVDNKPVNSGETIHIGKDRISNGGFTYYNFCDKPLTIFAGEVTGSWKRNNLAESDEPVKRDIFKLYFSHGCLPVDSSYAYAVCGGAHAKKPTVARIVNTGSMQAVELEDGSAIAVFYQPGDYTTARGKTVSSTGGICII